MYRRRRYKEKADATTTTTTTKNQLTNKTNTLEKILVSLCYSRPVFLRGRAMISARGAKKY
jgi:hypothetical protein